MKERIKWIDVAKGICILSVILGHISDINPIIRNIVFSFHLSVFFILSGYTLHKQNINKSFLNKKFNSLMKPYFYTCFFVMLMDLFNAYINNNTKIINITKIISDDLIRSFFASGSIKTFGTITLPSRIGAIWFLPALFFGIVFIQLVLNKLNDAKKQFLVIAFVGLISSITGEFIWLPFSIQAGLFSSIFIYIGYYIKQKEILNNLKFKHYIIFIIIFLIGILSNYSTVYFVTAKMSDYFITTVVSIASSLLIIKLSMLIDNLKFLNFIGQNSLLYLCVHLFELNTLKIYGLRVKSGGLRNRLS